MKYSSIFLTGFVTILLIVTNINFPSYAQKNNIRQDLPELYHTTTLVFGKPDEAKKSLTWIQERNKPDLTAHLITAMRFSSIQRDPIAAVLQKITGHDATEWFDWMLWQQGHPEITPHKSLLSFKSALFNSIDPSFTRFFRPDMTFDIRPEEIVWGGVPVDGIPALDNPAHIEPKQAKYLEDSDAVFGIEINGDARAYPLRIMGWHEMFNDVVGGVPISLAYCTLCNAGIAFEGDYQGREKHGITKPFTFGSSGFLYQSNKLMYDHNTDSLWNQFTGKPVAGKLRSSGIRLRMRPVVITSWKEWKTAHPKTKVLDINTGFNRDYGTGVVYRKYFASPKLMFPALGDTKNRLAAKDQIFGLRVSGGAKAWPLSAFTGGRILNDTVGLVNVVLISDAKTRTVRAYKREKFKFSGNKSGIFSADGQRWKVTEEALIDDDNQKLNRLPGHISYWFAWAGYLGEKSSLFNDGN